MNQMPSYHYVRWTWSKIYKISELTEKLKDFAVILLHNPDPRGESIRIDTTETPQLEVKADTLSVFLAPSKAVLFQKENMPFTKRDMELREIILALYSRSTQLPLPFFYQKEPKFDIDKS